MPERPQNPANNRRDCDNIQPPEKSARDREIEVLERKLLAAKALIDEGLSRLKELKAA